jgi:hypothetical protein
VSLDELRDDLKRNMAEAGRLTTVAEIRDHLVNTVWPFIEAKLDVVEEIDDAVGELVDQQEDYLQTDTAAIFATLVQSSLQLAAELRKRADGDQLLAKRIDAHELLCQQAMTTLGEITMIDNDDDGDVENVGDVENGEGDHE